MIWTKGAYQSAKFQNFDCSPEISPNLYFDSLKFEEKLIFCFKNDKNVMNFDMST